MRDLPDCNSIRTLAHYCKSCVIKQPYIADTWAKRATLQRVSLEGVQLDKLVEAPDSDRAIKTCRHKTRVAIFDQFHLGHHPTMALESVHDLLRCHLEVPFEYEHVSESSRYHKVVHRVVNQDICYLISVLSRHYTS